MYKIIQVDIWSRTKKSDSDSQCCYEYDSTQKPVTRYDSATLVTSIFNIIIKKSANPIKILQISWCMYLKNTKSLLASHKPLH